MRNLNHKHYLYAIGLFLLALVTGLWSWNTLSELFNLPQAQYKHVLAAFFILLILRWGCSPSHRTNPL
jgi:uncharacterized membrane protein